MSKAETVRVGILRSTTVDGEYRTPGEIVLVPKSVAHDMTKAGGAIADPGNGALDIVMERLRIAWAAALADRSVIPRR